MGGRSGDHGGQSIAHFPAIQLPGIFYPQIHLIQLMQVAKTHLVEISTITGTVAITEEGFTVADCRDEYFLLEETDPQFILVINRMAVYVKKL
jgi:hypothetical protein